ncbi:MAG: hypothetical protein U0796_17925 [Gemmatales bacterium]
MRITLAPTLEEHMDALHRNGWSTGDVAIDGVWVVYCTKDEHVIHASHEDRTKAWALAEGQARIVSSVPIRNN